MSASQRAPWPQQPEDAQAQDPQRRRREGSNRRSPIGISGKWDEEKGQRRRSSQRGRSSQDRRGRPVDRQGKRKTSRIEPEGESGRRGLHPWRFVRICAKSSCRASMVTNFLWPFTIAALILHFGFANKKTWVFITSYIGMVPAANLLGFAGQELARKVPKVLGIILETTLGSIVEMILFIVLLVRGREKNVKVIQAAILGSILANLLLCLGLCFFIGGIFHPQQTFHEAISEVGSNLMLVAGMGLIIPTAYYNSLGGRLSPEDLDAKATNISQATALVLLVAFFVYLWFQSRSHHGLYEDILSADEQRDHDREKDLAKPKLTLTESIVAVVISLVFVSFMAVLLVENITHLVEESGIKEHFLGLILVPLVEKASEHLTAIDEAYDNQMNFALAHVLGASIQTALLNTPIVVITGWGLQVDMNLNFQLFDAVVLILAIIVVGNFLRDEKSDYLEGALSVFVYIIIAVAAFNYPDPVK